VRADIHPENRVISEIKKIKEMFGKYPIYLYVNLNNDALLKMFALSKIYWNLGNPACAQETALGDRRGTGVSIIEAMNAQCVPVAIAGGIRDEIIGGSGAGVMAETTDELFNNTVYLQQTPDLLKQASDNAYKRSLAFSKERFILEFEKYIKFVTAEF
jgi:glycosyltransferase involved in cell wall biosynthesis